MIKKYFTALVRIATTNREDNITAFKHFLAGRGYASRLINVAFNLGCAAARAGQRTLRSFRHRRGGGGLSLHGGADLPPCGKNVAAPQGRCAIIAETSIPQCLHYRVNERRAQLRHLGWDVSVCSWHDFDRAMQDLQLASLVIFYRVPMLNRVPELFAETRRLGLPVMFDIDDLIFDREHYADYLSTQTLDSAEVTGLLNMAGRFLESMDAADTLMASTTALGQLMSDRMKGKPCSVVHNSVADSMRDVARTREQSPHEFGEVRMFYGSGSRTHDADFALIAEPLLEAMRADTRLHLHLHGYLQLPPGFTHYGERVHRVEFLDKHTYYKVIADYDIALMPLEASVFNDTKSNIKYQEASLFGIPSIVSPRADFLEAVTHGEDGLIAHTPEQWRDAVLTLASSPELRTRMGEKAHQNVLARYASAHIAETELRAALPLPSPAAVPAVSRPPRILLVNVLFGLSSFGGATMVVEDTARELRKQGLDVHVFSTLRSRGILWHKLVRYGWDGVNAIAVNGYPSDGTEHNFPMARLFRRVLRAVRPDLVHFHCIQDMGLGMLHCCLRAGIPYVIGMHDAWWVCPRQFMMDKADHYCAQETVNPAVCRARCDFSDTLLYPRRLQMHEGVNRAEAIFAPSQFYTAFIRRNFPQAAHKIHLNRNGIYRPPARPAARETGPLRLAYLGGKAHHKGYYFLMESLRALGRTDFELLLVDLHTASGECRVNAKRYKEIPQGIRTRIIPFVPHDAIDTLYRQMDVLLFPSLWDESFGLIVREAIVRDIFVVASQCGGPSEAIVHGENGLLFPKGDKEAFRRHLLHILDNAHTFTAYRTTSDGDVISVEEQARELATAYTRIITDTGADARNKSHA